MKSTVKVFIIIGSIFIGLALICLLGGFIFSNMTMRSYRDNLTDITVSKNLDNVKSIISTVDFGDINLEYGSKFSVQARNISSDLFEAKVKNDTLYIDYKEFEHGFWGNRFFNIGNYHDIAPIITVTVPENLQLEDLVLNSGAADIRLDGLKAIKSELNFGAGNLIANDIEFDNFISECGAGNAEISGIIKGDSRIESGVGKFKLDLIGNIDDYNVDVDCGIGSVTINGDEYGGIGVNKKNTSGAENHFRVDCGAGEIIINIEE